MRITYKDERCIIIDFTESKGLLRRLGWLGDEEQARLFKVDDKLEIRIFKNNGESYSLNEDSKDPMVKMKIKSLLDFAKENTK